ncbi:MAG TPA: hypothetical protein VGM87_05620 [Roseomonas sp.]|jgi:hypothetical protein
MTALAAAWTWFIGSAAGRAVLAVAAALGALWLAYAKGGAARQTQLQADAQRRDLANRDIRDEVDRAVAREPDPADRLRRDWSRD